MVSWNYQIDERKREHDSHITFLSVGGNEYGMALVSFGRAEYTYGTEHPSHRFDYQLGGYDLGRLSVPHSCNKGIIQR